MAEVEVVGSSVVATASAAEAKEEETASLMNQYGFGTPTEEQTAEAKLVKLSTSDPSQAPATHSPTALPKAEITQRHPVSQYGHGVEPVDSPKQFLAHSGDPEAIIGSAKPLTEAVCGTDG